MVGNLTKNQLPRDADWVSRDFVQSLVQDLHAVALFIQKHEAHGVKHRDFDVQVDTCCQAVNEFLKFDRVGVEIDFFDLGSRGASWQRAPERSREHSIKDQRNALNVGLMERLW